RSCECPCGIRTRKGLSAGRGNSSSSFSYCSGSRNPCRALQSLNRLSRPAWNIAIWSSPISQVPSAISCNLLARQVLDLYALLAMDNLKRNLRTLLVPSWEHAGTLLGTNRRKPCEDVLDVYRE